MQLVRPFAGHHQRKDFKTRKWNPRSCGFKYRILCTGEIILRYEGKTLAMIDNPQTTEQLMLLKGNKLDKVLEKFL